MKSNFLFKSVGVTLMSSVLVACGGGGGSSSSGGDTSSGGLTYGPSTDPVCSVAVTDPVDWNKLATETATNLSEYKLFQNQCDPTANPNTRGLPYDLTTQLFTDYASKYRFIFVPPSETATYHASDAFDFPDGSVITKTFAMPENTSTRGYANEYVIETRLLIKRSGTWITLPYVWNEDKTDAVLDLTGETVNFELEHDGNDLSFTYVVPKQTDCSSCHADAKPIGPKARFLNKDYSYDGGSPENQLQRWETDSLLTGAPVDKSSIDTVPTFTNDTDIVGIANDAELARYAKGWLDINCSHCHDDTGGASHTALNTVWPDGIDTKGVCSAPVTSNSLPASYMVEPGNPSNSMVAYRMDTDDLDEQMPPLGRASVHGESVELITAWINSLTPAGCP